MRHTSTTLLGLVIVLACVLACGGTREEVGPAPPEPGVASPLKQTVDAPAEPHVDAPAEAQVSEPEPAGSKEPSGDEPSEPETFTPATRGSGGCEVRVIALLEAEEYRGGGPITPALEASLAADPEFARMYNSESHGDYHIQCHYEVELGHEPGKRYRWRMWLSNTLREHTPKACNGMAAQVAEDIVRTTKNCTDLAAGAYWGLVLEPM